MTDTIRSALLNFRDSSTHSSHDARKDLQAAFLRGCGTEATITFYRVCKLTDNVFRLTDNHPPGQFTSGCKTLSAARDLLRYPPDPLANLIVEVKAVGKIIHMLYDDDNAGNGKRNEEEVLVALTSITSVQKIANR